MAGSGPGPAARDGGSGVRPVGSALPADLVRALDWLQRNLQDAVRLDELARVAGVRPRTLEAHFKLFLGVTPLGWLRRARLAAARQQLRQAGGRASVTEIALASGFNQLGRFAGEYRRAFGEPPSVTLRRARDPPDGRLERFDDEALRLTWRALPAAFAVAPRQCDVALAVVGRAQELAPDYGLPKAIAAWCHGQRAAHRFRSGAADDRERACRMAADACALAPDDPLVLTLGSGALVLAHRVAEADRLVERALALNPWAPWAWLRRGWISVYLGEGDAAIREFGMALHLMPFEPLLHLALIGIGCAHFAAGRHERAVAWVSSGLEAFPGSFWAGRVAAAAAAHAGSAAEARRMARRLLRSDPDLTVAEAMQAWPFTPALRARLGEGLERAGVPRC